MDIDISKKVLSGVLLSGTLATLQHLPYLKSPASHNALFREGRTIRAVPRMYGLYVSKNQLKVTENKLKDVLVGVEIAPGAKLTGNRETPDELRMLVIDAKTYEVLDSMPGYFVKPGRETPYGQVNLRIVASTESVEKDFWEVRFDEDLTGLSLTFKEPQTQGLYATHIGQLVKRVDSTTVFSRIPSYTS